MEPRSEEQQPPAADRLRLVLDTNVLYSAFRSPAGASRRIVEAIFHRTYAWHVSVPLLFEYEETLKREREDLELTLEEVEEVEEVLLLVAGVAAFQEIYYRWRGHSPDPDDDHVLETAVAAPCDVLLTFNTKDLEVARTFGLTVATPGAFLRMTKNQT